jgi:hypothetical protein
MIPVTQEQKDRERKLLDLAVILGILYFIPAAAYVCGLFFNVFPFPSELPWPILPLIIIATVAITIVSIFFLFKVLPIQIKYCGWFYFGGYFVFYLRRYRPFLKGEKTLDGKPIKQPQKKEVSRAWFQKRSFQAIIVAAIVLFAFFALGGAEKLCLPPKSALENTCCVHYAGEPNWCDYEGDKLNNMQTSPVVTNGSRIVLSDVNFSFIPPKNYNITSIENLTLGGVDNPYGLFYTEGNSTPIDIAVLYMRNKPGYLDETNKRTLLKKFESMWLKMFTDAHAVSGEDIVAGQGLNGYKIEVDATVFPDTPMKFFRIMFTDSKSDVVIFEIYVDADHYDAYKSDIDGMVNSASFG